jgi:hypothetical protein
MSSNTTCWRAPRRRRRLTRERGFWPGAFEKKMRKIGKSLFLHTGKHDSCLSGVEVRVLLEFLVLRTAGCDVRPIGISIVWFISTNPGPLTDAHDIVKKHDGPRSTTAACVALIADLLSFVSEPKLPCLPATNARRRPGAAVAVPVVATAGGTSQVEPAPAPYRGNDPGVVAARIVWPCPLAVDAYVAAGCDLGSRARTARRVPGRCCPRLRPSFPLISRCRDRSGCCPAVSSTRSRYLLSRCISRWISSSVISWRP